MPLPAHIAAQVAKLDAFADTDVSDRTSLNRPPLAGTWDFVMRGRTSNSWSVPLGGSGPRFFDSLHLGAPKGACLEDILPPGGEECACPEREPFNVINDGCELACYCDDFLGRWFCDELRDCDRSEFPEDAGAD
ncbi:MAG: hypothetical protein ACI81R_002231 [Bradymonadia bacterium]|jgi:hypothetical protein